MERLEEEGLAMEEKDRRDGQRRREKRSYTAPSIKKVALRPEEAVLGFCKNNTTPGPRGLSCQAVGACSTQGT